jgi:hypothetical protein
VGRASPSRYASHPLQLDAAEYLSRLRDPALVAGTACRGGSASVGLGAHRRRAGRCGFDRTQAIAFLRRELTHRDLWICVRALEALNRLTGQSLAFDFRVPSERRRAVEAFAATP